MSRIVIRKSSPKNQEMNIATVKINEVRPYWRNPRKNDETVEALKDSIERYGYTVPIVVDAEGVILAGHARYRALVQLGYEEIRIVQVDLPEEKARQFRVADNKAGEFSEWDMDTLKEEFDALGVGSLENLAEFFTGDEWSDVLDMSAFDTPPETDEERLENQAPAGSAPKSTDEEEEEEEDQQIELLCPHCLEENVFTIEDFRALVAKAKSVAEDADGEEE